MIRLVRLLWSLVGLLLILGGTPAALIWWRGWPLPTRLPADEAGWQQWLDHPINASSIQNTAACLIWLLWALTAYLLAANLLARLRRTASRRPRFRLAAPLHTVASSLIGTVVLGLTSTTSRGVATTADPPPIPASGIADTTTPSLRPASATTEPPARADRSADQQRGTDPTPATMVYEVRRGDRVWDIAERFLADAQRYPDIAALNPRLADKYGARFPDHIEPGDRLRLPTDARDRGPRRHATGTTRLLHPPTSTHTSPDEPQPPPPASPPATPAPSAPGPSQTEPAAQTAPGKDSPARSAPANAAAPAATETNSPSTQDHAHPDSGIDLGDRGWVTIEVAAAVAATAALVWIHRRRRYRPQPPGPARRNDPDLTPLPHTVAALHHSRRASPAEDDMDAPEPQTRDAAQVTTATLGSQAGQLLHLQPRRRH